MHNKSNKNDIEVLLNIIFSNIKKKNFSSFQMDKELFDYVYSEVGKFINKQKLFSNKLIEIGKALSAEKNIDALLEMIVIEGMNFTNSDGGTIYVMTPDKKAIDFKIMITKSLDFYLGGTSGNKIPFPAVKLYNDFGEKNEKQVSAYCAINGKTINIEDVYKAKGFDFQGTKKFDESTGYRSKSMLVMALKNHDEDVIGVLQLLNATDENGITIPFSKENQIILESLASQAAISLANAMLIQELKELLDSFIKAIAVAIDDKTPYTAGHIQRVAEISMMLSDAMTESDNFMNYHLNSNQREELRISAWMHDVGKISTPEHVMDKQTKLETKFDRIRFIRLKFELLKKELEMEKLRKINAFGDNTELEEEYKNKIDDLNADFNFILKSNTGSEFTTDESLNRIKEISKYKVCIDGCLEPLLTDDEVMNLCIRRGTLNDKEREIINNHVKLSIKMLSQLRWPEKLKKVPEYAGAHHEKLDGSGYPLGLTGEKLSTQARIIAVADIFEALSAPDRPYKKGKKLSETVKILEFMVKDGHIDGDIIDFFIESGIILAYSKKNLSKNQIDDFEYKGIKYTIN